MRRISIAVRQNDVAVSMIESGRYNDAISILKALIPQFQDDLRTHATNQDTSRTDEPSSFLMHQLLLQSANKILNRRGGANEDEQEGFLYDQPIEIPHQKVALETHAVAVTNVSCILVFNLALTLQLKAIAARKANNTRISDQCYANSITLYRLVVALNGKDRLLSMVVLNNVALIHQGYKEKEKAQACFQHLLAIWITSSENPEGFEGMVYNAMGWYNSSSLSAAAA